MKATRPRIWTLGVLFAVLGAGVAGYLGRLMLAQNEVWLERSYRNRWVFRDVPTRRGSLLDRRRRPLVEDEPAFALLLYYRAFRRQHPVGCAVCGANLVMLAAGLGDDEFSFEPASARRAFATLLGVRMAWLAGRDVMPDSARDLRFYVTRLVRGLSDWSAAEVRRRLEGRARDGETLAMRLGGETVGQLSAAYEQRLRELGELNAELAAVGASTDLWREFEEQRRRHFQDPAAEHVVRVLQRRIPFDLAAKIRLLGDRHPGLTSRPSVRRARRRPDLRSLEPVLGYATRFWREDRDLIGDKVDEMLSEDRLDRLLTQRPDLPEELDADLAQRARQRFRLHYQLNGRRGKHGLEKDLDDLLAGRPGLRLVERDRGADERGQWSWLQVAPGQDVRLTIDIDLQALLEQVLDETHTGTETAMAVIEPRSGDVLALGGRPLPEGVAWVTPAAVWKGNGFLGSLVKPFVALEHLDARRHGRPCADNTQFQPCDGSYRVGRRRLTCDGRHGVEARDVVMALAHSCNIFFYQAAEGLGRDGLMRAFARAGWVRPGEGERAVGAATYQDDLAGVARFGVADVTPGHHLLERQAIGYGVQAGALHVARAYAALATGVLPRLGLVVEDRDDRAVPLACDPADLAVVRAGLAGCVRVGTARRVARLRELGVLGKTGTAEVWLDARGHERRNNAWFAGYLTEQQPTLAFAAAAYRVANGQHGADVAGRMVASFLDGISRNPELRRLYLPGETGR